MKALYVGLISEGFAVCSAVEGDPIARLEGVLGTRRHAARLAESLATERSLQAATYGVTPNWVPSQFLDAGLPFDLEEVFAGGWTWL